MADDEERKRFGPRPKNNIQTAKSKTAQEIYGGASLPMPGFAGDISNATMDLGRRIAAAANVQKGSGFLGGVGQTFKEIGGGITGLGEGAISSGKHALETLGGTAKDVGALVAPPLIGAPAAKAVGLSPAAPPPASSPLTPPQPTQPTAPAPAAPDLNAQLDAAVAEEAANQVNVNPASASFQKLTSPYGDYYKNSAPGPGFGQALYSDTVEGAHPGNFGKGGGLSIVEQTDEDKANLVAGQNFVDNYLGEQRQKYANMREAQALSSAQALAQTEAESMVKRLGLTGKNAAQFIGDFVRDRVSEYTSGTGAATDRQRVGALEKAGMAEQKDRAKAREHAFKLATLPKPPEYDAKVLTDKDYQGNETQRLVPFSKTSPAAINISGTPGMIDPYAEAQQKIKEGFDPKMISDRLEQAGFARLDR